MNEFDDKPWLADARALLDESARALDAATLSRLNRARHAALAQHRPRWRGGWLPAAGLAASCALLLGVAVWTMQRAPPREAPAAAAAAPSTAALGDDDSLEFYQDLEFYAWLDAEQDGDGDG